MRVLIIELNVARETAVTAYVQLGLGTRLQLRVVD